MPPGLSVQCTDTVWCTETAVIRLIHCTLAYNTRDIPKRNVCFFLPILSTSRHTFAQRYCTAMADTTSYWPLYTGISMQHSYNRLHYTVNQIIVFTSFAYYSLFHVYRQVTLYTSFYYYFFSFVKLWLTSPSRFLLHILFFCILFHSHAISNIYSHLLFMPIRRRISNDVSLRTEITNKNNPLACDPYHACNCCYFTLHCSWFTALVLDP